MHARDAIDIRASLEARRRELALRYRDALDRAEAELAGDAGDLIDVANDRWDAHVLALMSERDARELEHVVAALRRLDRGHYGRCTRCGGRIGDARLRALPEATRCTRCA